MIKMFVVHLLAVGLFQVALLASGVKSFSFYTAFLSTSLLMAFNLLLVYWSFQQIFTKKSVALPALIIVSKWLVVGFSFFLLIWKFKMDPVGILFGVTTFVPPIGYLIWKGKKGGTF